MTIKALAKLFSQRRFDEWLDALEKEPPRKLLASIHYGIEKYGDDPGLLGELDADPDRRARFEWLASSQREREYFMSIPDEKMTKQDWFDFRACDF